jgi:glutamate/aspartate transport system ATP-binding protein
VKRGDVTVVCGPSGSGKSTLIKTINGLEPFFDLQHAFGSGGSKVSNLEYSRR